MKILKIGNINYNELKNIIELFERYSYRKNLITKYEIDIIKLYIVKEVDV